jgi:polar amino acid transport system substrate-binding protein
MTRRHLFVVPVVAGALVALLAPLAAQVATPTLDRISESGHLRLGYRLDVRPFSYRDDAGEPAGYSVELCRKLAVAIREELRMPKLVVDWEAVSARDRFEAVRQGSVDILCAADTATLGRRRTIAFSIPIFPGGIGVLLRADAPARLKNVLSGRGQTFHPTWRASVSELLQFKSFAAVNGTTADAWLHERIADLNVVTTIAPVPTYDVGADMVLARTNDALFGERAILLDIAQRRPKELVVLDRLFTYEPLALPVAQHDERFRLIVDRALSHFYAYGHMGGFYTRFFGEPGENALAFFRWNTIPD